MRIAFAGTPIFAKIQLAALLEREDDVVVVYTQPDKPAGRGQKLTASPVKNLALEHHLPLEQPSHLKNSEALSILASYQPDLLVVAAYGLILPQAFLDIPKYGCMNVHPSLLPRWRGATPIQQPILMGETHTGVTLMKMDSGLDTGDILLQESCEIDPNETTLTLHNKLAILGASMLRHHLEEALHAQALQQQNALACYAPKIEKSDAKIHWQETATQIHRKIRAFNPWPMAFTTLDSLPFKIGEAQLIHSTQKNDPGTIFAVESNGIAVSCQEGSALLITQGQLPGKKMMTMNELLKGHAALFSVARQFK